MSKLMGVSLSQLRLRVMGGSLFEFRKILLIHGELGDCCRLCGLQSKLFFKLIEGTSLGKSLSARVEPNSLDLGPPI